MRDGRDPLQQLDSASRSAGIRTGTTTRVKPVERKIPRTQL